MKLGTPVWKECQILWCEFQLPTLKIVALVPHCAIMHKIDVYHLVNQCRVTKDFYWCTCLMQAPPTKPAPCIDNRRHPCIHAQQRLAYLACALALQVLDVLATAL